MANDKRCLRALIWEKFPRRISSSPVSPKNISPHTDNTFNSRLIPKRATVFIFFNFNNSHLMGLRVQPNWISTAPLRCCCPGGGLLHLLLIHDTMLIAASRTEQNQRGISDLTSSHKTASFNVADRRRRMGPNLRRYSDAMRYLCTLPSLLNLAGR